MTRVKEKNRRVLIINEHSLNHNNATAITMRSLWADWSKDSIFELCYVEYTTNVFSLSHSILLNRGVLNKVKNSKAGNTINSSIKNNSTQNITIQGKLLKSLRDTVIAYELTKSGHVDKTILSQIDVFRPEVIYTLGGSSGVLKCAFKLSIRYNIPIVLHFMDNWIEHMQNENNMLFKPFRKSLNFWLNKCIERGKLAITISDSMADAYSEIYPQIEFVPLMNAVDVDSLLCKPKNAYKAPFVFTYAGGLHLDRWKSLLEVGKAIKENDIDAVLRVYTSSDLQPIENCFIGLPVEFFPAVDHDCIRELFYESDCLVHTESTNQDYLMYNKYSISTKIPEYLASGRLMLFYGPRSLGLYKYLDHNNVAALADNYVDLKSLINNIYLHKDSYDNIISNAINLAREKHNTIISRITLQDIIDQA